MTDALAGRTGSAWGTRSERWAALTEPEPARALLQDGLPGFASGALVIERCDIVHLRFRTSARERQGVKPVVAAAYALEVRDEWRDRRGTQLLHVAAYEGRGRGRYTRASAVARAPARFGAALAYLPELDAVAWGFPNDPRLDWLPELVRGEAPARHLPTVAAPERVATRVLRWKPGTRCVVRYEWDGAPGVVAKTVRDDAAAEIARRMEWLWRRAADDPASFTVARPLGVTPALHTAWQEAVAGAPLMEVILGGADGRDLMDAAARGLAALHRIAPAADLPRQDAASRLRWLHGGPRELAAAVPELRGRLEAMTARLAREAERLPAARPRLVHGDFLLKQLVVDDGRLAVFDFDDLMAGDCLEDVGKCLADLHYWDLDPGRARALAAAFLESYRAHADWDVPLDALRWHYGVELLGNAWYWFKRRQFVPGFERELEELLARADDPPLG